MKLGERYLEIYNIILILYAFGIFHNNIHENDSKRIIVVNVKGKTTKLLQDTIGETNMTLKREH